MRKQNVSTESAKKQIANEKKASFASDAVSSSAASIDVANAASGDPTGLRMDQDRTKRFTRALFRMVTAVHSLEAAAKTMKGHFEPADGVMDPCATIRAFSTTMNEDISVVYQMLANEEKAESDASKGGE